MSASLAVVQSLYASFAAGNVPAVLAAFDPQIEWLEAEGNPLAGKNPYAGPEAVLHGVFLYLVERFDDFAATPVRHVDGGDTVVTEGRYTGTHKATGAALDAQFAHVWRFEDGKIASFQQYTDTAQWAKLL
ncbi:MAG: nuclear transport factor 2 family protein [Armatimonadetes bacterium]|nr:nuclear transport factor 2 family protein [Armatimonadota bacterium]